MLQRAMIATALLCDPQLLVMDEPTTALDVTIAQQILALVLELKNDLGFGVLLITHNLEVVHDVCDRVAVLYAGRVVEVGPTESVLRAPSHPYTRGLIGALPSRLAAGESLTAIPGTVPGNLRDLTGCAFASRCPHATDRCRTPGTPPSRPSPPCTRPRASGSMPCECPVGRPRHRQGVHRQGRVRRRGRRRRCPRRTRQLLRPGRGVGVRQDHADPVPAPADHAHQRRRRSSTAPTSAPSTPGSSGRSGGASASSSRTRCSR